MIFLINTRIRTSTRTYSGLGGFLPARAREVLHHPEQGGRLPPQAPLGEGQQGASVVVVAN